MLAQLLPETHLVFIPSIQCLWSDAWAQICSNTRAFLAIRGEI